MCIPAQNIPTEAKINIFLYNLSLLSDLIHNNKLNT